MCIYIHRCLEIHATFNLCALSSQLQRIGTQVLITSCRCRYAHEVTHPCRTTQFSTTRSNTANTTSFLTRTNLFHLNTHAEFFSEHLNQLTKIDTVICDIIEYRFATISLILNISNFHIEHHIFRYLTRTNHRCLFFGFCLFIFLNINWFHFTIHFSHFVTFHIDTILLYLAQHQATHQRNHANIMTRICFNSHHLTFLYRNMLTIHKIPFTCILKLHFHKVGIQQCLWQVCQPIHHRQLLQRIALESLHSRITSTII